MVNCLAKCAKMAEFRYYFPRKATALYLRPAPKAV